MIGVMSMKEDDVIRIAMNFVAEKGLDAKQVERVKFVDVREVPERFRRDGNFWVVGFMATDHCDTVVENSGVVLNISDVSKEVRIIN